MEQKVSVAEEGFEKIVSCYTAVALDPLQRGYCTRKTPQIFSCELETINWRRSYVLWQELPVLPHDNATLGCSRTQFTPLGCESGVRLKPDEPLQDPCVLQAASGVPKNLLQETAVSFLLVSRLSERPELSLSVLCPCDVLAVAVPPRSGFWKRSSLCEQNEGLFWSRKELPCSVTTDHLPEMLLAKLQFDRLDAGNRAGFLSFVD
ncbi:hypothetical protein Q9966_012870 [Columba livia]|nr:hypothetical protein Q9966_012870 [Columba livia]